LKWHVCYIESNNAPEGEQTPHCQEIIAHMKKRGWNYTLQNMDNTRSPRCVWRIKKK